ncbi:BZ3500_MvSof-1268-A1-R1_Chr2-2g04765 [Microbotryum saponariae]|uniref:BZ3500_MvSof-1268-A1-R1_Chr2-2g04765 protein n=1 Tax=Microbotryum saponariae TaxID=289078 RepID=A0A2X0K4H3_9BASI|nr:BZ3500_MvSof-1268-A1-R1_Chr2-2g04765 [Microbotryum saponariae]SDA00110.1 BZ3501_MvSof-1269-A2-R1_Chr2-2g04439 [Microbotryum saponariae]
MPTTKPSLSATLIKRVGGRPVYVVAPPRRPGSMSPSAVAPRPKDSRSSLDSARSSSQGSLDDSKSSLEARRSLSSSANLSEDTSASSIESMSASNLGLDPAAKTSAERAPSLAATSLPVPQIKPKPPHHLAFEFRPLTQSTPSIVEHERFPAAMEQDRAGIYAPRARGGPMMRNITTQTVNEPVRKIVSCTDSRAESEEVLALLGRSSNVSKGKAREVDPLPSSTFDSPSSTFCVPSASSFLEQAFSSPIARRTAGSPKRPASPGRQANLTQAQEQYPTPRASTSLLTHQEAAPTPTLTLDPLPPTAASEWSNHEDGLRRLLQGIGFDSKRARKRVSRPEGMIDWWEERQEQKRMKKIGKGKGEGKGRGQAEDRRGDGDVEGDGAEDGDGDEVFGAALPPCGQPNQNVEIDDPMGVDTQMQQNGDEEARQDQDMAPPTRNDVTDDGQVPDVEQMAEMRRLQHAGDDGLRRLLGSVDPDSPRSRKRAEPPPGMVSWTAVLTPRSPKKARISNALMPKLDFKCATSSPVVDKEQHLAPHSTPPSSPGPASSSAGPNTPPPTQSVLSMMPRNLLDVNDSSLRRMLEDVEAGDKRYRKRTERLPSMLEWSQVKEMNRKTKAPATTANQAVKPKSGRKRSQVEVPVVPADDAADLGKDATPVAPEEPVLAWHPPTPSSNPKPAPDIPPTGDDEQIAGVEEQVHDDIAEAASTGPLPLRLIVPPNLIAASDEGLRRMLSDVAHNGPRRRRMTEQPPGMVGWKMVRLTGRQPSSKPPSKSKLKKSVAIASISTGVVPVNETNIAAKAANGPEASNGTAPQTPARDNDLIPPDSSQAHDEAEIARLIEELRAGPDVGEELRQCTERLHELADAIVQRRNDQALRRRRSDNYFEDGLVEVKDEDMEENDEDAATQVEKGEDEEAIEEKKLGARLAWASPAKTSGPKIMTWVKSAFDRLHWLGERVQFVDSTEDARLRQISADLGEGSK